MDERKKYCQRCRQWAPPDGFNIIKAEFGYKKDRLCMDCRMAKNEMKKKVVSVRVNSCYYDRRKKELALIPNPFEKNTLPEELIHPLLWTGNA